MTPAHEIELGRQSALNWSAMVEQLQADAAEHKRRILECEERLKQTARKLARSRT